MASECSQIDIGFVEECEDWKLHSRFFPSKVGGKPAWLKLNNLPQPSEIACVKCKEPSVFLCQIYAPIDDNPEAFHRTIFVFTCKNNSCCQANNSENFIAFRCQLKKENEFYPSEPPVEENDVIFDDTKWSTLCIVCGAKGPNHCAKCKIVNYCSRSHQVFDWKNGHKEKCSNIKEAVTTKTKSLTFPQWELIIDEETKDLPKKTSEEEELEYLNKLIVEKKAGSLIDENEIELEQYANTEVEDRAFEKFKKRIDRDPGQVLRYDRGGTPLWIASQPRPEAEDIPNCPYCNSKRQFECQIMPQLLNFLDLDNSINCIDWGIVAIYTCENNCSGANPAYKKEYVFKQDVAQTTSLS